MRGKPKDERLKQYSILRRVYGICHLKSTKTLSLKPPIPIL